MKSNKSKWKGFGLCGAILATAIMAILAFSPVPRDSIWHPAFKKAFWFVSWPIMTGIDKGLYALGIEGDQGLGYMVPIIIVILLYWAIIGFIIGALIAGIRQIIIKAQQAGPEYPPQSVGSPDP
mgnify:CR=1 FL=1